MTMTRAGSFHAKPVYRPRIWPFLISAALWVAIVFGGGALLGWWS